VAKVTRDSFDVLIVGGGPAGMAAASAASGVRIGIVDENATLGGQIWRGHTLTATDRIAAKWYRDVRSKNVVLLAGLRVFDQPHPGVLAAEGPDGLWELQFRKLILATGARERFLPFPGWTLRNVIGAGGLQAMVKSGLPIAGKQILIAGTGPLLLAVASFLRRKGASIVAICEQAPFNHLLRFSLQLLNEPGKLLQGLHYRQQAGWFRYHSGWWAVAAHGERKVESVTVSDGHKVRDLLCDYFACGFHLVPNIELPAVLGCRIENNCVAVDAFQQTSVAGVYCAGESTSIGGLDKSLLEGQIAGFASTGRTDACRPLIRKQVKLRRFAAALEHAFALRAELRSLPQADTLVCRCEDVNFGAIKDHTSWRSAKLHTRCGMGPCQGRICGAAAEFLLGWNTESVRPPMLPVRYGTIVAESRAQEIPST
jgi:D-hydroxyproline dehydrogenase subunit alpha